MSKFKFTFELEQQTPMIHFQSDEPGACLRGSEVKPKLDRFIHDWIKKKNNNNEQEIIIPDAWYINKKLNNALNYKMRLETTNGINMPNRTSAETNDDYTLFLGNLGITEPSLMKKRIKFGGKIKGTITSFVTETLEIDGNNYSLLEVLKSALSIFFTVNNFGMRQTKGYGSFKAAVRDPKFTINLNEIYPKYFYIQYLASGYESDGILKDIWVISNLMKSGFNRGTSGYVKGYALKYLHSLNLGNDKAFIKRNVLVGDNRTHANCHPGEDTDQRIDCTKKEAFNEFRFIRGMLGLPGFYPFNDTVRHGEVNIIHDSIERFASPIIFKKHGNRLYIFPNEIPNQMYGTSFEFNGNEIQTPTREEFNLVEFLDSFAEMFNKHEIKFQNPVIQSVLQKQLTIRKYTE